jgi:hypothetical protein
MGRSVLCCDAEDRSAERRDDIYGNSMHGNGLKDRSGTPFRTWQDRFIDWFRDLGILGKPGVETKDIAKRGTPR